MPCLRDGPSRSSLASDELEGAKLEREPATHAGNSGAIVSGVQGGRPCSESENMAPIHRRTLVLSIV
jgi:hypothetical protein